MIYLLLSETTDAHALLRRAAKKFWGLDILPTVDRQGRGKPRFPQRPDLQFNLSHSGPWSLCALSDHAVGVDIERIRPRRDSLPRKTLSHAEFHWFQERGGRWEDFYTLWTLKEARVKLLGTGLSIPPRDIAVPLLEPGQWGDADNMRFTAYGGVGWRAALCTENDTALLKWFSLS